MAARLVKVFHVRLNLRDEAATGPHPLAALNRQVGAARILRDQKAAAQEQRSAPPPPQAEKPDDSAVVVLRDDRMVPEDRGREPLVETDIHVTAPPPEPRERQSNQDERLSIRTIAATMAAVIVLAFAFTLSLPLILTRDGVESAGTIATPPSPVQPPPVQPTQSEQFGAIPPRDPGLAQLPGPVPSEADLHPDSYEAWSLRDLAPALRAAVPTGKQAGGRAAGAEVAVPTAAKGATTNLTAAEKAAVTRGVNELKNTAAVAAPPRPAPARRPALTDEEKAAVERGLRELEKTAGQAKP